MERSEDASPLVMGEQVPFAKMAEPYGRASTGRVRVSLGFAYCGLATRPLKGDLSRHGDRQSGLQRWDPGRYELSLAVRLAHEQPVRMAEHTISTQQNFKETA